jgi:beta-glucanase (GH16 family)
VKTKVSHRRAGAAVWAALLAAGHCAAALAASAGTEPPWRFSAEPVWQDEFEVDGRPDPARWDYDLGGDGWGNNELQHYTDREQNARVRDGMLVIEARQESFGGNDYTSARLVSKGRGDFLYGRFEVRAQLPTGRGTWPAIWMLPTGQAYGGWPHSGEIDIMEHVGHDPGVVHASVHTGAYNHRIGTQKTASTRVDGVGEGFHVYRVDWTPREIRAYIDGEQVFAFANEGSGPAAWPFDQPFHLLLNIAVGGDWGGKEGVDATAFPATMRVDWVRVHALETP